MIATNILGKFIRDKKKCQHKKVDYDFEHKSIYCTKCDKVLKRIKTGKSGIHIGDMFMSDSGRVVTVLRFTKSLHEITYATVNEGIGTTKIKVELPVSYLKTWRKIS